MSGFDFEKMNILDKSDKSLAAIPHRTRKITVPMREKYDWSTGGDAGTFRWVKKSLFNIDSRYQRDQVSQKKVMEIAKRWDWLLLGSISVIEREDGSLWVFDGGHRVRASFYRDDIDMLPCLVHHVSSVNDEAKAFVARNTMVSNVSAFDRFRASVVANEPVAKTSQMILDEFGLTISKAASTSSFINCVGAVNQCVEQDADATKKVIAFLLSIPGERIIVGKVLLAVFTLYRQFLPRFDILDRYGEKLARYSLEAMEKKIQNFSIECGKRGNVVAAKALLELINKGNRNRVEWGS